MIFCRGWCIIEPKGDRLRAGRLLLALVLTLLSGIAAVAQTADFVVVNRTGATIYFLYASPSDADSWAEDLLGNSVLPSEGVYRVRLRTAADRFDVRAVDANDNEYIVWNWAFSLGGRVLLTTESFVGHRASPRGGSPAALSWITIVNDTNYDIAEVRVIPAGSGDWDRAEQVLAGGELIHFGEDYRVELDTTRFATLVYDIMLVDVDGDRYVKWDVNLELVTEVVYTLDDLEWR